MATEKHLKLRGEIYDREKHFFSVVPKPMGCCKANEGLIKYQNRIAGVLNGINLLLLPVFITRWGQTQIRWDYVVICLSTMSSMGVTAKLRWTATWTKPLYNDWAIGLSALQVLNEFGFVIEAAGRDQSRPHRRCMSASYDAVYCFEPTV